MNQSYDAVVVGAGFAGMYMLHRLREMRFSVRLFEAASGVGGTWYWNCYPGARCDVESMEYSYQFSEELQQEWEWSERYPAQPEILGYANHVADRFGLREDIQFDTRVASAHFDDAKLRWDIELEDAARCEARFVIMATGCLSSTNTPDFPGLGDFGGEVHHTGRWPHHSVDFSERRVGVIGTGSSGVQVIPIIAEQARELFVFQRTPAFSIPARNTALDPEEQRRVKEHYAEFRAQNSRLLNAFSARWPPNRGSALHATPEEREREFEKRWQIGGMALMGAYSDLLRSPEANAFAAEFVRGKIREIVHDPKVAEMLCSDQLLGCKRPCLDTNYYATFNRSNVSLVDVSQKPIERFTPTGLCTNDTDYPVDMIVLATGFDAMTGALLKIDIRGRNGVTLQERWKAGPRTFLGLGVNGFPNFFTISGPGSPSVLTNMMVSIDQHVNWIANCLMEMQTKGHEIVEATREAEDAWIAHVNEIARSTLYPTCNSWYLGANVPGKPRVFMPYIGYPSYVEKCNEVVARGYDGFELSCA